MDAVRGRPARRIEDPRTEAWLRKLSKRIRSLQDSAQTLEEERNQVVRQAIAAGWTHAQIAEVAGLTRARVGQIALGKKR